MIKFSIFKKKRQNINQKSNSVVNMRELKIVPFKRVNDIEFEINRNELWNIIGKPNSSFKKTNFSNVETDVYDFFHIYYDDNYNFKAIEIFGDCNIYYNNDKLPKNYSLLLKYFKNIYDDIVENENGFISKQGSIGVYKENDDDLIDSILFGCENYYKSQDNNIKYTYIIEFPYYGVRENNDEMEYFNGKDTYQWFNQKIIDSIEWAWNCENMAMYISDEKIKNKISDMKLHINSNGTCRIFITTIEELQKEEKEYILKFVSGQASDGLGEGNFDYTDKDNNDYHVSFWNNDGSWYIKYVEK